MVKLVMIVAPKNFRDEEYFIPKSIFEKNEFEITTASLNTIKAEGKFGRNAKIDIDISKINERNFDGIVFIGGLGATIYQNNSIINKIIYDFSNKNKLVAAICIAPTILAYSGILSGKNATVWNGDNKQEILFKEKSVNYQKEKDVVVAENFITANGPNAAEKFANEIVNFFKKIKKNN